MRVEGDTGLLTLICAMFFEDYPAMLSQIKEAVSGRDAESLTIAAHTLKGAISNLGAHAAQEAAYRLEMMGRDGNLDQAGPGVNRLEVEVDQLKQVIGDFQATGISMGSV